MTETHAWNEKLDLGHEAMDHEHHLQIALVSAFIEAVEQRRPALARQLADQLVQYSTVHVGSEELLMQASSYAGQARHAGEHAEFLEQMRGLAGDLEAGAHDPAIASAIDLRAALAAHMNEADRRLALHVGPRNAAR
jgi:hemerythrin